jgi:hypothetical protein
MGLKMGRYQKTAPTFYHKRALRTHTRILALKVQGKAKNSRDKMAVSDRICLALFISKVDNFSNRTSALRQTQRKLPMKNELSRSRKR